MINGLTVNPEPYIPPYRSVFVVEVEYMLGDADAYETKKIEMNEASVIAFKNLFDHGTRGKDDYQSDLLYRTYAKTFAESCTGEEAPEEDVEDYSDWVCEHFAQDPDGWGGGSFHSLSVLWYDENGLPHEVEFWWG